MTVQPVPADAILDAFTGQLLDPNDLPAIKAALAEIEAFINDEVYGKHRQVFRARADLRAALAEIEPITLPRRSSQTNKQAKVDRCPRCNSEIVTLSEREAESRAVSRSESATHSLESEPEADAVVSGSSDTPSRLPPAGAREQSSDSETAPPCGEELSPEGATAAAVAPSTSEAS